MPSLVQALKHFPKEGLLSNIQLTCIQRAKLRLTEYNEQCNDPLKMHY